MKSNRYFLVDNSDNISNLMASLSITFESQLYLYIKDPASGIVNISEVYKIEEKAPTTISAWSSWSKKFGFLSSPLSVLERRNDLKGLVLSIAAVDVSS